MREVFTEKYMMNVSKKISVLSFTLSRNSDILNFY